MKFKFRSPIDGFGFLDPETSMRVQRDLSSDIAMVLDECTPSCDLSCRSILSDEFEMGQAK